MNYYLWVHDKLDNHDSNIFSQVDAKYNHNFFGGEKDWRYTKIQGNILIILLLHCCQINPEKKAQVHIWFSCLFMSKTTLSNSTMHSLIHTLTHTHTVAICHTLTFPSSPCLTVLPGHMLTNDSITLLPPHYGG